MFNNIEQLEEEIKAFHKNVLASNEFITRISELISTTRSQKEEFAFQAEELIRKMESYADATRACNEEVMKQLVNEIRSQTQDLNARNNDLLQTIKAAPAALDEKNRSLLNDCQSVVEAFKNSVVDALVQLESTNAKNLEMITARFKTEQNEYIKVLARTEQAIKSYETEVTNKYEMFVQKLESTNIDSICKTIKDMQDSSNKKIAMLFGVMGITIALVIISILIR